MRTKELFKFVKERHSIWDKKDMGLPKPWTKDRILQKYKFCNVYRELDTQTIWFAENWRKPNENDPELWFASLVFRFINWHGTAEELGYPVPWNGDKFVCAIQRRKDAGQKIYSGAYMISTHGVRQEKHLYLRESLDKIWGERKTIRPIKGEPLVNFHARLMCCFDVGSFLAAQVVADIKYVPALLGSADWHTFAASGPGSRRGLNRVYELHKNDSWKEESWKIYLECLKEEMDPMVEAAGMPKIHAQDLQNCLCEFDKYERVRLGEGNPKSRYEGV